MKHSKEKDVRVGRKNTFAMRFAFQRDPHGGRAATPEETLSWGAFEIWVDGVNLCQHLEMSETVPSVHWYLLPLLEWLTTHWDFLLHEERPPVKAGSGVAWLALEQTARPPAAIPAEAAELWEQTWQNWWLRHSLLACREGGLFPSVIIRRWQDRIEFSWGNERLAGYPDDYRFDVATGCARLSPREVADVLHEALRDAAEHLRNQMPESTRLTQLVADILRLATSDHRRRLGLLAGFPPESSSPDEYWSRVESYFPAAGTRTRDEILGAAANDLVVEGSCQAALMFGTLSPTVTSQDAMLLAERLVSLSTGAGDGAALSPLVRAVPLQALGGPAWQQGYELAKELWESMGEPAKDGGWLDMDEIYSRLGLNVEEVLLDDSKIRAVAIAGPRHRPTVLLNRSHEFQDETRRRFTLAHELCHVLHDRGHAARLAIASGPWAPPDVEQRANAFAAMLLMPEPLVADAVASLSQPVTREEDVWRVANRLHTSFTATIDHLYNLGYVDDPTRDAVREHIEMRTAAKAPRRSPLDLGG
jgi:Zn-dependent peptidase ImmA (M78 family)